MQRTAIFALVLLGVFSNPALAQLPGDFNCSGEVNGIDFTYWYCDIRGHVLDPVDTASCSWRNGDFNGDGWFYTVADGFQLHAYFKGEDFWRPDIPPLPTNLDSLIMGEITTEPGQRIRLPLSIVIPEDMTGFEIQVHFDTRYFSMPWIWQYAPSGTYEYTVLGHDLFYMFGRAYDSLAAGRYHIADLEFNLSPIAPLDTTLTIDFYTGSYFPSGFANLSYPRYFIIPTIVNGQVHVGSSGIDEGDLPNQLSLRSYPNPFNAEATISFSLDIRSPISLKIFDVSGREVARLVSQTIAAGQHAIIWNATDMPSGIYFCRLETGQKRLTQKITLLK